MICSTCGQDHQHQENDYPLGALVRVTVDFDGGFKALDPETGEMERFVIHAGSYGHVVHHHDDGRAVFVFDDEDTLAGHTFHYPESYIRLTTEEERLGYEAQRNEANNPKVIGAYVTIEIHLNFSDIAEKFNLSVDEVRQMWNDGRLEDYLNQRISAMELLRLAADIEPVDVGDGYF